MSYRHLFYSFIVAAVALSCNRDGKVLPSPLFEAVDPESSGLTFSNDLTISKELNPYTYRNFYNGGGVAIGDLDNDGLQDIYLSGNMVDNALYRNVGDLQFTDVTKASGTACSGVWSTGISLIDIDVDGLLDIYVCKAGPPDGSRRHNELFINQGNMVFSEQSAAYGLDISTMSVQAAWLDYDRDGDLDCYLLSNSIRAVGGFDFRPGLRDIYDASGNKLLRNDNGVFVDVTRKAGIYSNSINYGLDVAIADYNIDGWPDIFVSNDFFEKDYLYINQTDGTFVEIAADAFTSMSMGSMGVDVADLNGDLLPDLFVTEMLPAKGPRQQTKAQFETWDKYQLAVRNGYHHQFARNMLHLANDTLSYIDISRSQGVDATEWSWSVLLEDFDNDADTDIFVSSGIGRDLLDKDYLNYVANDKVVSTMIDTDKEGVFKSLVDLMPSQRVSDKMFLNNGRAVFTDGSVLMGIDKPSFSNGSVAADLDNDGDLDLVVSTIDETVRLFENTLDPIQSRSLSVKLVGDGQNPFAIGARVDLETVLGNQVRYYSGNEGFMSSYLGPVHFGLGDVDRIDRLTVHWPDGRCTTVEEISADSSITILQREAIEECPIHSSTTSTPRSSTTNLLHQESSVSHFTRDRLLPSMEGFSGPVLVSIDLNSDGKEEIIVAGGKNQSTVIYEVDAVTDEHRIVQELQETKSSETTDLLVGDFNKDGHPDLYEAHGGRLFSPFSFELHDVLYLNDGKGQLRKAKQQLPFAKPISTGAAAAADLNDDGNLDVVVGERLRLDAVGLPGAITILYGDGKGGFQSHSNDVLSEVGMITDIVIADMNGDRKPDIISCGKWSEIEIYSQVDGKSWQSLPIPKSAGLWRKMLIWDVDGDGDLDVIAGNEGSNSAMKEGMTLYVSDFDGNGALEQIIGQVIEGKEYPLQDIDGLYMQMPSLHKKYASYAEAAEASLGDWLGGDILEDAYKATLKETRSTIFMNEEGSWSGIPLPKEVQYSSVSAIHLLQDGRLIVGGNDYQVRPRYGRLDASFGWILNTAQNAERYGVYEVQSQLAIIGQMRSILAYGERLYFGMNNDSTVLVNLGEL